MFKRIFIMLIMVTAVIGQMMPVSAADDRSADVYLKKGETAVVYFKDGGMIRLQGKTIEGENRSVYYYDNGDWDVYQLRTEGVYGPDEIRSVASNSIKTIGSHAFDTYLMNDQDIEEHVRSKAKGSLTLFTIGGKESYPHLAVKIDKDNDDIAAVFNDRIGEYSEINTEKADAYNVYEAEPVNLSVFKKDMKTPSSAGYEIFNTEWYFRSFYDCGYRAVGDALYQGEIRPENYGNNILIHRFDVVISFDTDGGSAVEPVTAGAHYRCNDLPVPEKEGYVFGGWWYDDTVYVDENTYIEGDVTLKAGWKKEDHKELITGTSDVYRIYGENRYQTAEKIADTLKEQTGTECFENIIVASGTGFADALSGAYLAKVKNAPILLVNGEKPETQDEVKRYIQKNLKKNGTVYILGGEAAVPETMEYGLDGYVIERLAGKDRYETNIRILEAAGVSDEIIIARGNGESAFADSLSAGASGRAIMLVHNSNGLNGMQKDYLSRLKTAKYYIAGGEKAVPEKIRKQVETYGNTERIAGKDRYETSAMIANKFNPDAQTVVLAYGGNYPDGLCGSSLALCLNAQMLLTKTEYTGEAADFCKGRNIRSGYVLGGNTLISDEDAKLIIH